MAKFLIVGAGAIGAITGCHLIEAGHDVDFVEVNQEHIDAVRRNGLRLSGAKTLVVQPKVTTPEEAVGPYDKVLLAVKSQHTLSSVALLEKVLSANGYVVSLQNGLEEYVLADALGRDRVIGAYLTFGGFFVEPGHIKYGGQGGFKVGELGGQKTDRLVALADYLAVQQPVDLTGNIFGYLWAKMALGAVYFGTAIADMDVVEVYADPQRRAILGRLCGEVVAVANAHGVQVETSDGFDPKVFSTSANDEAAKDQSWDAQRRYWGGHDNPRTGIWRDLAVYKRQTEVESLVGKVLALAAEKNIAAPMLQQLRTNVQAIERGELAMGTAALLALGK